MSKSKKLPPVPASSITVTHLRPLEALRKGAPPQTKLSVSRGARLKKQRSANMAHGHGNLDQVLKNEFPNLTPSMLADARERILIFAEQHNSGELPGYSMMHQLVGE